MTNNIIKLNIGGIMYTTTRSTLCKYTESMLGAMFNGSMDTTLDENGCYFIDRDGELFKYILNFLRSSKLVLPGDFNRLDELRVEADFYQIAPLIESIAGILKKVHYLTITQIDVEKASNLRLHNSSTRVNGRKRLILAFLSDLVDISKLETFGEDDSVEVGLKSSIFDIKGGNHCDRIGEVLCNHGWKPVNSHVTQSTFSREELQHLPGNAKQWYVYRKHNEKWSFTEYL